MLRGVIEGLWLAIDAEDGYRACCGACGELEEVCACFVGHPSGDPVAMLRCGFDGGEEFGEIVRRVGREDFDGVFEEQGSVLGCGGQRRFEENAAGMGERTGTPCRRKR